MQTNTGMGMEIAPVITGPREGESPKRRHVEGIVVAIILNPDKSKEKGAPRVVLNNGMEFWPSKFAKPEPVDLESFEVNQKVDIGFEPKPVKARPGEVQGELVNWMYTRDVLAPAPNRDHSAAAGAGVTASASAGTDPNSGTSPPAGAAPNDSTGPGKSSPANGGGARVDEDELDRILSLPQPSDVKGQRQHFISTALGVAKRILTGRLGNSSSNNAYWSAKFAAEMQERLLRFDSDQSRQESIGKQAALNTATQIVLATKKEGDTYLDTYDKVLFLAERMSKLCSPVGDFTEERNVVAKLISELKQYGPGADKANGAAPHSSAPGM